MALRWEKIKELDKKISFDKDKRKFREKLQRV